jgi:hypothetical protein
MQKLSPVQMVAAALLCACLAACSGEPKAPPPVAPPAGAPQAQAGAPPLDPARVAELKASLDQLQEMVAGVQGASPQGRARLVQQQLQTFLDSADQQKKLPFRRNLERIVKILSETTGDELSDSQKQAIRQEIQAIQRELGLQDTSSSGSQGPGVAPPPPGGPGGPAPGGPGGPAPGGPGPGPGGPGPGGPGPGGPGGPPHPGPPAP